MSAPWRGALTAASEAAYQAVMKPVEGTILTVVRESSAAAAAAAADGGSLLDVAEAAKAEAEASLARTPELLPVLAESGVVDAGGSGYVLLLDALLHVIDGRPVPEPVVGSGILDGEAAALIAEVHEHADHGDHDISDLRYEVMYFLDAPDETIDGFKQAWAELGDSIVVVGGDGIWNCHVHTDDIGAAVEAGIAVGPPAPHPGHRPARRGRRRGAPARRRGRGVGRRHGRRAGHRRRRTGAHRGGRRGHRPRRHEDLPVPRRARPGRGRPDDEPVHRAAARGRRAGTGRRGRDPAEQQEHHPGRRAGRRPDVQDGAGGAHHQHRRGLRLAHPLRPRGQRRRQRRRDAGGRGGGDLGRGDPGGARLLLRPGSHQPRATSSASGRAGSVRSRRARSRRPRPSSTRRSPTTTRS